MTRRIAVILTALLLISIIGMIGGWRYYSKRLANYEHSSLAKVEAIEGKYQQQMQLIIDTLRDREIEIAELQASKRIVQQQLITSTSQINSLLQRHKVSKSKKDTSELLINCDTLSAMLQQQTDEMNNFIELTAHSDSLFQAQLDDKDKLIAKKDSLYSELKRSFTNVQKDYSKLYLDNELLKVRFKTVRRTRNIVIGGVAAIIAGIILIK